MADTLAGVPLELLLSPPALALLGLMVGSFLNVVVYRLPLMLERQWWRDVAAQAADAESHHHVFGSAPGAPLRQAARELDAALAALADFSLARPASRCPSCGHAIRWYENIPLLSWLVLRGRCSACAAPIPVRYPLVEVGTAALFGAVAWRVGAQPTALLWCAAAAALLALALIDWDTTLLPDSMTLPLLWAGLCAAALGWLAPLSLAQSLAGAVVGYLSLWSVYWFFKLATGKEGMGYGDFKLLAALGAWLGWQAILPIVLMASVIGAVVGLAMKAAGALREGRYVPFGPFLAGGGLAVLLIGLPRVLEWMGW
ncbi:Leader peptidase / N-methyltransferase [Rubrivivax sp. A210]|nr:Leader peptidase / N-methyltransferase [Rubrivivax sp. A210]